MAFIKNTAEEVLRKLMTTYVKVDSEWVLIGYKIPEAVIELNNAVSEVDDILGIHHKSIDSQAPAMAVAPGTLLYNDKLQQKLYDIQRRVALAEYSGFEVMNVFGFSGTEGAYDAEVHKGCTIELKSIGGEKRVEMPYDISYSNDKVLGTVNTIVATETTPIVFTELAA